MKVLFLTRLYYPHIGGVERHVRGICRELSKRHHIKIITQKYDNSLKDYEKIDGVEVHRMRAEGKWEIWSWMKSHQDLLDWADVIHAHDVYFWIMPYKLMHPAKKTCVTFHGWEGEYPVPWRNKIVRKISERLADGNICVGDFIAKWYGTKPDYVTYGAVDQRHKHAYGAA